MSFAIHKKALEVLANLSYTVQESKLTVIYYIIYTFLDWNAKIEDMELVPPLPLKIDDVLTYFWVKIGLGEGTVIFSIAPPR